MYTLDFVGDQRQTCVLFRGELHFGTIVDLSMLMGGVLPLGWGRVPIFGEYIEDVAIHCKSACAFDVVPGDANPSKFCTSPVCGTLQCSWSVARRWSACCLPTYLIPKSLMMRKSMILGCHHLWHQRPGVVAHW